MERLRNESRPKLSIRAAAEAAGISDARWRQIAKGHNQAAKDVRVPARAPADTLARMARVVGATADQLREVGREDAADELAALKMSSPVADHLGALETLTDEIYNALPDKAAAWPDMNTEGGRLNRQSLTELIMAYTEARDLPPSERADLMIKALLRSIGTVRQILVRDGEKTVRAHAIDALNPAEAAIAFLKEAIEEMKGIPHADQSAPPATPAAQSDAQETGNKDQEDELTQGLLDLAARTVDDEDKPS